MLKSLASGPTGVETMATAIADYCGLHNLHHDIDRQAVARRVIDIYSGGGRERSAILAALSLQDGG